jgi:phage shock protein A
LREARGNTGEEFCVATLVRANLNDLLDQAENPEKMLKQVILDMENQFMQVKTQVAIALADLRLLEKKKKEYDDKHAEWMNKADLAVDKKDDELARAALQRGLTFQQLAESFARQMADQEAQVESLKSALKRLELKHSEARAKADLLIMQHRRSRARRTAKERQPTNGEHSSFERVRSEVVREEALSRADGELLDDDIETRLDGLEREQKIDSLLKQIKARKGLGM